MVKAIRRVPRDRDIVLDRSKCQWLAKQGKKNKTIAKLLGRSQRWVTKWKNRSAGQIQDKARPGRPRCLSRADLRFIETFTGRVGYPPSRIAKLLDTRRGVKVCPSTVRTALLSMGYRAYLRQMKPPFTDKNVRDRAKFARQYGHWTAEDWDHVVFSDECYFPLFEGTSMGNKYIWAKSSADVKLRVVPGQAQRWMVEAWITSRGVVFEWFKLPRKKKKKKKKKKRCKPGACTLCRGSGKRQKKVKKEPPKPRGMNQKSYLKITEKLHSKMTERASQRNFRNVLRSDMLPQHDDWWFMRDGATSHTGATSQRWLHAHFPNLLVTRPLRSERWGNWPGNSPDLNPIENFWAYVKFRMYRGNGFRSVRAMKAKFKKVVGELPQSYLQKLCRSMVWRLRQVRRNPRKMVKYQR